MEFRRNGEIVFAVLKKDEDVFKGIEEIARKENIRGGTILTGIGMLKEFRIGYWNGQKYEELFVEKNHELVGFHGSISTTDPILHIHAALAGPDHRIIGGHLISGKVDPLLELTIIDSGTEFKRIFNQKTNLKELSIL
ncbi:MAG: PPC domain-containing DNA-binding protein [Thermoplasmata archaeon]